MTTEHSPKTARALELCSYCPRLCHHVCPAVHGSGSEEGTAWGMMTIANAVRLEHVPLDSGAAAAWYRCASCLRCQSFCKHGNNVPEALNIARAQAVAAGVAPQEVHALRDRWRSEPPPQTRARADAARTDTDRTAPTALLLSSVWFESDAAASSVPGLLDLVRTMTGGPVDLWVEGVDACCGGAALRAGLPELAESLRTRLRASADTRQRVVTDCADSLAVLGERGEHLLSLLARHAPVLRARTAHLPTERLVWHGGCRDRRQVDTTEWERTALVAAGGQPEAILDLRASPECCGGEVVYATVYANDATAAARSLLLRVTTPGDLMVTSQVRCAQHMVQAEPTRRVVSVAAWIAARCARSRS